ncbi:MAG: shikimate kinase [Cytophagales bacterium]|nr:shikimate kinase [Cytophagales bacterium]
MRELLFLVGLPFSGKTMQGRRLAAHLGISFWDTDEEICRRQGMNSVSEIFVRFGETYFREQEKILLKEELDLSSRMVVSTGGGTPCFFDLMSWMNQHGSTFYLELDWQEMQLRASSQDGEKRPLWEALEQKTEAELLDFFGPRITIYQKAHVRVKMGWDICGVYDRLIQS